MKCNTREDYYIKVNSRLSIVRNDSSRVEFELPMLEVGVRVPVIASTIFLDSKGSLFFFVFFFFSM